MVAWKPTKQEENVDTLSYKNTPYNAHSSFSNSQTLFFTFFPVFIILKQYLLENWCKVEVRKYNHIKGYCAHLVNQFLYCYRCLLRGWPTRKRYSTSTTVVWDRSHTAKASLDRPGHLILLPSPPTCPVYKHVPTMPAWVLCSFPFWEDLRISLGRPWAQPFPALASQVSGITGLYQEGFQHTDNC